MIIYRLLILRILKQVCCSVLWRQRGDYKYFFLGLKIVVEKIIVKFSVYDLIC